MNDNGQGGGASGRPLWQPLAPLPASDPAPPPSRLDDAGSGTMRLAAQSNAGVPLPRARPTAPSGFPPAGAVPPQRAPVPPFPRSPSAALPPARGQWAWWIGGGSTALVLALAAVLFLTFGTHAAPRSIPSVPTAPTAAPTAPSAQDTAAPAPVVPSVPSTSLVTVSTDGNIDTGDPALAPVVALLDRHFGAINAGDYTAWSATVTSRRASAVSPGTWRQNYASTQDASVVVGGLQPTGGGYLVTVAFVSTQDPAEAPADLRVGRICWSSTWPVVSTGGGLVLDTPASGSTTKEAC